MRLYSKYLLLLKTYKKIKRMEIDDDVQLSSDTMLILQQFLKDKAEREEAENQIISGSKDDNEMKIEFEENWV